MILLPRLNFWEKFFLLLLTLFVNFECKCAQNSSEKRKAFFMNVSKNLIRQPSKGMDNQVVKIIVLRRMQP
jgi:hypothetical protein